MISLSDPGKTETITEEIPKRRVLEHVSALWRFRGALSRFIAKERDECVRED
jgi:hypothetical protein